MSTTHLTPLDSSKSSITIGIVGGGIGGVVTAIVLGRIGYTVHLFEQAANFAEIGAGISLGPNSLQALSLLSTALDTPILKNYEAVATIEEDNGLWFRFTKWDTQETVAEVHGKGRQSSVHRARLLESFLPLLPVTVTTHFSSKVTKVENLPSDKVLLHTSHPAATFEADVCIGCDGVKSAVRASLGLGGVVRYTGTYAYRGLLPIARTGEVARVPRMWMGPHKHVLTFPIEQGHTLNLVAFVSDHAAPADARTWSGPWVVPTTKDDMKKDFAGWDADVLEYLDLIEKPERWALHELVPLTTWTEGRITLLGDSAHASLPHNGAGAGQATEDAYVLAALLRRPECTNTNIDRFLQAYERVRLPRAARQQVWAVRSGEVYDLESPMGDDWARIGENLKERYRWIWEHDLEKDVEEAVEWLKKEGVVQ
ncbi:FAD/NAD(P)-binding domain-containing protein [Neolentinus lepideus HHB14362 ss-1]|uniref:FAD/NAD(P)-binding domain-containing protein n=1 Tax=Neolentinus lepideus HHB14362 ss-1 TaxID=1314782 RepID=A0A165SWM9_9AGAM|nr:FAD/NAD(P)-binding domain-containing protein [Neolentinus lepideus HHB14362 ss-1]